MEVGTMRAVVINPVRQRVVHVPEVFDLVTYCATRLGEMAHSYPLSSPTDSAPGLSVCREESEDLLRPGQRYFRFSRCPITFPGLCIFFGQDSLGQPCSPPDWFWNTASRMPLWCDPSTRFKEYTQGNFDVDVPGVGMVTQLKLMPVFMAGEMRDGERQVSLA
jgi:hypothetical protein